jgi:hypothetical protein
MAEKHYKDFLEEVEDLLKREQIYKDVDNFITKLALCPRCKGGPEQTRELRNTIHRMVQLVTRKMDSSTSTRTKKIHRSWLQRAAKALEVYQVVDRDWINANVCKLPDRPAPRVQDYDPDSARRDIRFYPNPDPENLLKRTEEERMEVDVLDATVNEEELLATPTRPATAVLEASESLRRSPRLAKRTSSSQSPLRKGSEQTSSLQATGHKEDLTFSQHREDPTFSREREILTFSQEREKLTSSQPDDSRRTFSSTNKDVKDIRQTSRLQTTESSNPGLFC